MIKVPGYQIQRELGKGGMATVYLAIQESLNRPVALKILNRFDTKAQTERFFNEGKIIASLNHHNIITIYDLGEVNGHCFLAMEYLEGGDLRQSISQGLKVDQSIKLLKVIANCLIFVHEKGIIHRDIKPENILFRKDGTPVLTDFGVAKQLQTDLSITMDGIIIGSPFYISPEQAEHKPLDAKTDIYSLGVVFYEMLTGQKPFQGSSPIKIILAHLTTEAAPLPKHLERYQVLLDFMISKDTEDRFKSATDLIAFLDKVTNPPSPYAVSRKISTSVLIKGKSIKRLFADETKQLFPDKNIKQVVTDIFAKGQNIKRPVIIFLPFKKYFSDIKLKVNWLWSAVTVATIAFFSIYFFTGQTAQISQPATTVSSTVSEDKIKINIAVATAKDPVNNEAIQQLLTQAQSILDDQSLTLTKLRQAADAYKLALNKVPNDPDALQGLAHIQALDLNLQNKIETILEAANKAFTKYRLTTPKNDNAWHYYQQVLVLDPNNKEARQGKIKVVNTYATLVEKAQNAHDYSKATITLKKGLTIDPESVKLLALKDLNGKLLAKDALKEKTQSNINSKLAAAEKALTNLRLIYPPKNNALYYFQEVLRLNPKNLKAKQGKFRIADAYADLAEIDLGAFDYSKAKQNIEKGLAINPDSERLLKLKGETNMFIDAPKRVLKKFISVFD